jgi:hypothetical protein
VKRVRNLLTAGVLLSLSASLFSETRITSVSEVYWTANDFLRVPEYFTGREYFGKQVVVRTDKARSGLYFVLELNQPLAKLPENSSVLIRVIRSDHPEAKLYKLEVPRETTERSEVLLGITGNDWNSPEIKPVAWRIELQDKAGKLIASKQSFLWGHPK